MKLSLWFLLLLALGATENVRAQVVELFGGYSYLRANTSFTGEQINLHGASFSAAFYLNRWLGIVGDVGGYHAGSVVDQFSLTLWSYQAGPRVRLRNDTRFTPYAQFLLGGGHAGGTLYTSSFGPGLAPIGTNNSFLYTPGGGVDCRLSNKIGIRIIQAEYLHSEFLNGSVIGHKQNNLRLSTGVVFHFGTTR